MSLLLVGMREGQVWSQVTFWEEECGKGEACNGMCTLEQCPQVV